MSIDLSLPWCTYRTEHATGLYYEGKGKTDKVASGEYKGSGIRFKLALETDAYAWDTWTTKILATYATEPEAYLAEEALVTHESLLDPLRLNMTAGGQRGKYKTHSTLLRTINAVRRAAARKEKKEKEAARRLEEKRKVAALKKQLKEKK